MDNIEKILINLKKCLEQCGSDDQEFKEYSKFWLGKDKKEIENISNAVLNKENIPLSYLDKYSLKELDYILMMFPLEHINSQLKNVLDHLALYKICPILEFKAYIINLKLIKKIKQYKNKRIKKNK